MMLHPFEMVSIHRLSQGHPRFWERADMSKIRAEIQRLNINRARAAGLGPQQKPVIRSAK